MSSGDQQLLEYIKDLQEKDKMNKQMIQALLEASDTKKSLSSLSQSAIAQIKKENDAYKEKCLHLLEQKSELIEIINAKNVEFEQLQKEYEKKRNHLESSTRESYGISNSASLSKMFALLDIKVTNGRYLEDNLAKLLETFKKILKTNNHLETDNKYLRDKLDEADKDIFKVKERLKTVEGSGSIGSQEPDPYEREQLEEDIEINIVDDQEKPLNMSNLSGLSGMGAMSKTFSLGPPKKKNQKVPKLDFSTLKHNKEFKDWYKYATKLELSVKSLRKKIKILEDEMDE